MNPLTVHEFLESIRTKYTSVGCYPKFWVTADGAILSYEACRENVFQIGRAIRDNDNKQWQVVGCDVNWENPDLICDHTNERIESAYAEPEQYECECPNSNDCQLHPRNNIQANE